MDPDHLLQTNGEESETNMLLVFHKPLPEQKLRWDHPLGGNTGINCAAVSTWPPTRVFLEWVPVDRYANASFLLIDLCHGRRELPFWEQMLEVEAKTLGISPQLVSSFGNRQVSPSQKLSCPWIGEVQ
jgi:hypothetical protein